MKNVFTLIKPENPLPIVFDSPHSGTDYPRDFYYACPYHVMEKAEDKYVDDLFSEAPDHGGTLLCANFPRTYIDVNRHEKDIDHELLEDIWPEESAPSARAHAGIGLVRRLLRPGMPVYDRPLSAADVKKRIDNYYRPYHETLARELAELHYHFGQVWHINCHSMPAQSTFGASILRASPVRPADFVLGDRDGTTCDADFTRAVHDFIRSLGYKVAINDPYKGVELVRRYSNPASGRYALQIEINKSLYMDENTCEKTKNYTALKDDVNSLIAFITDYVTKRLVPLAAD